MTADDEKNPVDHPHRPRINRDACLCAAYAGIGLDYRIGRGDLIANLDAFTPHVGFVKGAPSISATVGYRF